MRHIIVQEMLTVDGFFCGPNGEIDWHTVDAEFNAMAIAFLDTLDTLMFGRVTHDLMAGYWPTSEALKDDPDVARRMNALKKVVFSTTVERSPWHNTAMVGSIDPDAVAAMKRDEGKDIAVFGSGTVVAQLAKHRLIDEYRFLFSPTILGAGKTLFATLPAKYDLRPLEDPRRFGNGNVLVRYAPK